MQLVADRVESGERDTKTELAPGKPAASFLTQGSRHEHRENKILAKVTELSDEKVNQLDLWGG